MRPRWRNSVRAAHNREITAEVFDGGPGDTGPVLVVSDVRGAMTDVVVLCGPSLLMVAAAVTAALHDIRVSNVYQPTRSTS